MTISQDLEQAIEVLEANQDVVGEVVVRTAVTALREKLASLNHLHPMMEQARQITVLVADLSGFTAMAELMDAENVRDMINAVWQKLDGVIEAWGGVIDKHIGDAVIAFFGLNGADAAAPQQVMEAAVQAALDMQMELTLFNEQARRRAGDGQFSWFRSHAGLRMRIGINSGPVLFGPVGMSGEYTAMGDTVTIAERLEAMAPLEGVLIASDVYRHIQGLFDVQPLEPVMLHEDAAQAPVYVVKRAKPRAFRITRRGLGERETRLVGRETELEQLQQVLQGTIDRSMARVVTVVGEAGVGKSRLLYEFERWLQLLPVGANAGINLLTGRVQPRISQPPYALMRDVLANYFGIHRRYGPAVAREKLVQGIVSNARESNAHIRERAHFIGHLLGFDFSQSPSVQAALRDSRYAGERIRERALAGLEQFFRNLAQAHAATVLFLEDIHWADEGSLALLEFLVEVCQDFPLLLVCLARPELYAQRPSWRVHETLNNNIYTRLDLEPLSAIDSRHLLNELLAPITRDFQSPLPLKLVEQLTSISGGNPATMEELVRWLWETGVIFQEDGQWQTQMTRLLDTPLPASLAEVWQMRLAQLPAPAQSTLMQAAVIGPVFWESAVQQLSQQAAVPTTKAVSSAEEVEQSLQRLAQKEFIYRRKASTFPNTHEYVFIADRVQAMLYQNIPPAAQRAYHAQAAAWLTAWTEPALTMNAAVIAHHFAQAGDLGQAAIWYGRAAEQARLHGLSDTAITFYRHAINNLPSRGSGGSVRAPSPIHGAGLPQHITLHEGLGLLLQRQARFAAAVEAFQGMEAAASTLGNHEARVRAFLSLSLAYEYLGNGAAALEAARQAERVARASALLEGVALALAAQGRAHLLLGEVAHAQAAGQEALSISTAVQTQAGLAHSMLLLGLVCHRQQRLKSAANSYEKALISFRDQGDRLGEGLVLEQLGAVARAQQAYQTAVAHYEASLRIATAIGDPYGAIIRLRSLAGIARQQDEPEQLEAYIWQALLLAEKHGFTRYRAVLSYDLGDLYLEQAEWIVVEDDASRIERAEQLQEAYAWFERAERLAGEIAEPLLAALAQTGLARVLLAEGSVYNHQEPALSLPKEPSDAVSLAQAALAAVEPFMNQAPAAACRVGVTAWRVLGEAAAMHRGASPVVIGNQRYPAVACWAQAIRLAGTVEPTPDGYLAHALPLSAEIGADLPLEKARTLSSWAAFEQAQGRQERADSLRRAAIRQLGMTGEESER